jgi:hypothetical protein
VLDRGIRVDSDAAVAMHAHGDGERNQLAHFRPEQISPPAALIPM